MTLKAISLWQPWASLVAEGVKWVETRPNPYPWRSAVGLTVAIHATVKLAPDPCILGDYRVRGFGRSGRALVGPGLPEFRSVPRLEGYILPLGAIVATARLVDVVPMIQFHSRGPGDEPTFPWTPYDGTGQPPFPMLAINHDASRLTLQRSQLAGGPVDVTDQKPYGGFAPGRSALILGEIQKCTPFPCQGKQGLWTVPPEVAENLVGWAA